MNKEKFCFIIAPIGGNNSEIRKRTDQLCRYIIEPALINCGYVSGRADQITTPGVITNQIISSLISADLVIADLSMRNPNVFYELGIRHAFRKPVIHLIDESEEIPFDNAGVRAIKFNIRDLDSVDAAKSQLCDFIKYFDSKDAKVESPVSVASTIDRLENTGDTQERVLAAVFEQLSSLTGSVNRIEARAVAQRDQVRNFYARDSQRLEDSLVGKSYAELISTMNASEGGGVVYPAPIILRKGLLAHGMDQTGNPEPIPPQKK